MSLLAKCIAGMAFVAVGAVTASADIVVTPGNSPQQPDQQNVLFLDQSGTMVQGITNPAHDLPEVLVDFTSTTSLVSQGGQSSLQGDGVPFTDMLVKLDTIGATFQSLIFSVDVCHDTGKPEAGTLTITGTNSLGDTSISVPLTIVGNENFFTVLATNNQKITSVSFDSSVDLCSLDQVRIGGIQGATAVPLPAAALPAGALLGLGGLVRTIRGRKA